MIETTAKRGLRPQDPRDWAPVVRPALQEEVVARIRQLIDDGVLMPGSRIPERQLCAQLGISRTPLREAFRTLATAGLIEVQPRRGATVKRLQPDEIDHMFEALEALEGVAGELACERISDEELSAIEVLHGKMMSCYHRRRQRRFFEINQEIHERIVKAAANPVLSRVYEGLSGQIRRIRYLGKSTDRQWAIAAEEHEAIMQALKARNRRRLGATLRAHLKNKRQRVKSLLGT
ncbi:MAG: GntR family transcriptional regulator [Burkholderiales bacterium]|nr:GntR family transcriptional regulator [Burkholderiales bacterium]